MSRSEIDRAIDILAAGTEDRSLELHAAILDWGPAFADACNMLSIRVAQRFIAGTLDFADADTVMNWLWARVIDWLMAFDAPPIPEPMFSIYEAFDGGEYHRQSDPPDVDPAQKYTVPEVKRILAIHERTSGE